MLVKGKRKMLKRSILLILEKCYYNGKYPDVRLKMVGKVYPAFFYMDFQQTEMRKSIDEKK